MNWNNNFPQNNMAFDNFENFQSFPHLKSIDQFYESKFNPISGNNFEQYALTNMNMDLETGLNYGMNMEMPISQEMQMSMALGMSHNFDFPPKGIDMICDDQCRVHQCEECCECCYEEDKVELNTDYICPLGFLRICIIVR